MARNASPEEKKVYDHMVKMALGFIFDEKNAATIKNMVSTSDPVEAIPSTVAQLMKRILDSAKMSGKDVMMYHKYVAKEVMAHLIDMLIAFKVIPKEQAKQVLDGSIQTYAEITGAK